MRRRKSEILSITGNAAFSNLHLYGIDMLKDDSIAIIVNSMEKRNKRCGYPGK